MYDDVSFVVRDVWQKKGKGDTTFDVTMGSYDGGETCELVLLMLL